MLGLETLSCLIAPPGFLRPVQNCCLAAFMLSSCKHGNFSIGCTQVAYPEFKGTAHPTISDLSKVAYKCADNLRF